MPSSPTPSAPIGPGWRGSIAPDAVESINRRAVELAARRAGPGRFVLGCIGPTAAPASQAPPSNRPRSWSSTGRRCPPARDLSLSRGRTLCFGKSQPVGSADRSPSSVSLWEWPDPARPAARRLLELGAAVLGMNCQAGHRRRGRVCRTPRARPSSAPCSSSRAPASAPQRRDDPGRVWPRRCPDSSTSTSACRRLLRDHRAPRGRAAGRLPHIIVYPCIPNRRHSVDESHRRRNAATAP